MENVKDKEKRIDAEFQRLMDVLGSVPDVKRSVVEPLARNSAFMKVTLEDLQAEILESGIIEVYNHGGGQSGRKESSVLKTYNRLVKNYESITKTLLATIPVEAKEKQPPCGLEMLIAELERGLSDDEDDDQEEDV